MLEAELPGIIDRLTGVVSAGETEQRQMEQERYDRIIGLYT